MMERAAFVLLCAMVFTLPWEKSVTIPGLGTLTKGIGLLAFLAGAGAVAARRSVRGLNLVLVIAALFVCWSGFTWFWSFHPEATAVRAFTYIQLLVFAGLIWDLCRTPGQQDWLLRMYVFGSAVASLATIARYVGRTQTYYLRYAAPGFDPNDLGITVALSVPMALYLSMRERTAMVWLYRGVAALSLTAILLTASRTSVIAAFVGFAFVVLTWSLSNWTQRMCSVALLALLPAGMFWLAPKASRQRIATTTTEITRGTLHKRTQIWKTGLKALKQKPLVGVGAGAYPRAVFPWLGVPPVAGHEYVAHNSFLSVLVETGLVGAVLYGCLWMAATAFVLMMHRAELALWITTIGVWAIGAFMLTWEHRKPGWLILGLIMTEWARAFRRSSDTVPE